ncbi:hypothetical protein AVEN_131405-1 [Araneus ventricosus]|uniref:Uncharacterized protein n=1 Tax=Araneus ventricosus TaxID=182803 RepID=A0A4Y2QHY2_ARAVE|nr:hypothetical protein AVEN_100228-1 [Araneus ventricosus]GBN62904.1 hypothetical protein AVEN_103690-1 [Araneus ventricosus]GBN62911.1 hypothetical protein AVEN_192162-1 [Araneus ventricosus]GBN62921.1 hypothetical protein AVEN_243978-1 [Araneus ventricosus]GBN62938.1 hypothetical protein AVEN_23057-1 [Araneus ventricosus]
MSAAEIHCHLVDEESQYRKRDVSAECDKMEHRISNREWKINNRSQDRHALSMQSWRTGESSPSDYHPFTTLEEHLGGYGFQSDEDVKIAVQRWLKLQQLHFTTRSSYG